MPSKVFWRELSSDIHINPLPPIQYLNFTSYISSIVNSDLVLPATVSLCPVLTAVYRLSNISTQITFWETIVIQFVCSSGIEISQNIFKSRSSVWSKNHPVPFYVLCSAYTVFLRKEVQFLCHSKNGLFPNKFPFSQTKCMYWMSMWVVYLLCVKQVCWWVLFCGMASPPPVTIIKLLRVAPCRRVLSARCSSTLAESYLSTHSRGRSTLEKSTVWSRMTCCARYVSNRIHTHIYKRFCSRGLSEEDISCWGLISVTCSAGLLLSKTKSNKMIFVSWHKIKY